MQVSVKDIATKLQSKHLDPVLNRALKKVALAYKEKLISNMRTNKYRFKLAMSTIRARAALGKDDTPLIFTEAYIDAIVVKGFVVTVKKGKHYSGLTYAELSFMLEYGRRDKGIPARPVWRRTLEDFMPEINRIIQQEIQNSFGKR